MEANQTVQNDDCVDSYDHAQRSSDHKVADLVEADQKHTDNDAHQTTDAYTNPERLVLTRLRETQIDYASMFFKRSVAIISVGMPPAMNPQINMLN